MKKLFFLFIFTSVLFQAQEIEDMQEGFFFSETSKNYFRVDIQKPYDYYQPNSCYVDAEFRRAQFEGGDTAFNRELYRYISAYVDKEIYVVNGTFFLQMSIDREGKVVDLNVIPKVENSDGFLKDLKFAVKKIKKNWTPSKCNGIPVNSKIRIKLNFVTESIDV